MIEAYGTKSHREASAAAPVEPPVRMEYQGAEWMLCQLGYEYEHQKARATKRGKLFTRPEPYMSLLGVVTAEILGFVYRGIYHLPLSLLLKADWKNPLMVRVTVPNDLCNWDDDRLMRLVVLSNDLLVRLEIDGLNYRHMRIGFSQRKTRTGSSMERLPTIEEHVALIRKQYTIRSTER